MIPDASSGSLKPAKNEKELLALIPSLNKTARINFEKLENLDSTNINPNHWTKLILKVAKFQKEFEGIIITHGTDTMAYTASALSLAFGRGLKIPVVFTGSQLPLIAVGSDAKFNFENAVKVAIQAHEENIAEVMIVFSDKVLRANRTIKTSEAKFDAFDSPAFPPLAEITAAGVSFITSALKKQKNNAFKLNPYFSPDILTIDLVPGLNPNLILGILKAKSCKGLLLKSLGAGNVPSLAGYSFLPLIRQATKNFKIPVLVSTKFIGGTARMFMYELGRLALKSGAISTSDMTDVTAQVKLMWIIGQGYKSIKDIQKMVNTNFVGEISA